MLIDARHLRDGQPCTILGLGHTVLPEKYRYDCGRFIQEALSEAGRAELRLDLDPEGRLTAAELLATATRKFLDTTGISSRYIFPDSVAALAALAGEDCLLDAGAQASELDAILVGTNTSDSYTVATDLKKKLGAPVPAFVCDMQVACPVGAVVVQLGWHLVRSRQFRRVLVVGAEKASLLASADAYKSANLFGDAAFAMLLGPGEREQFVFFDGGSDPYDGKDEFIRKTPSGFQQNGRAVHEYVARAIPEELDRVFTKLGVGIGTLDHFFPHQPSSKTLDFLLRKMRQRWPEFRATVHRNVEDMGNTSGACTGWMLSRARREGQLRPGQLCLVASFGSGLSQSSYGFVVPDGFAKESPGPLPRAPGDETAGPSPRIV